jgi:hypothetical protein
LKATPNEIILELGEFNDSSTVTIISTFFIGIDPKRELHCAAQQKACPLKAVIEIAEQLFLASRYLSFEQNASGH